MHLAYLVACLGFRLRGESVTTSINLALTIGGTLSIGAALLHIAIIIGGPDWYRRFGAGERFASQAAAGSWVPPLVTCGIASVLFSWAAYAFSGAGLIPQLPFIKLALVGITAIYLLRGLVIVPLLTFARQHSTPFLLNSSLICLLYGAVHALGTYQVWERLSLL